MLVIRSVCVSSHGSSGGGGTVGGRASRREDCVCVRQRGNTLVKRINKEHK